MTKRAYFQYWESFEVVINKISDIEEREHFRKIIINYGLYGQEPAGLSELEEMAFTIIKDMIDQQKHRRQVNAENASRKAAETPEEKPKEPAEKKEPAARMVRPTLEEIKTYISEKGYNVDANGFFNYYEANGWKIGGRAPMKNWKAAVQNWNTRNNANNAGGNIYQQQATGANVADDYENLF